MNPSAAALRDRVGPYQVVKAIGAGGSARVDLARIERAYGFVRHVVIKRPLEHLRGDARAIESLRREARLGARLRHPNLVAVLDAGTHDGYDYLVLEYVQGSSLRTLMETDEPGRVRELPVDVALAIVRDVARALHQAHELADEHGAPLGLVHRDVSPGNVLVGVDGAVKLADFGIAKETRVTTLSGSMHGTVTYMAPEQCRGHAFDRRADIFSLGVILHELVTGTRLFWADNDVASLHRVLAGNVPRPRKVRATIAPRLEELVMTALAADPARRFATARALADELEAFATGSGAILAARNIAHWAEELLGPASIGEATVVDATPVPDEPLVELIAATPADEPPSPTFGPTEAADSVETQRAPAKRRSRRVLLGVLAAGAAIGTAATLYTMRAKPAPQPPPAVQPIAVEPSDAALAPDDAVASEMYTPETSPAASVKKRRPPAHHRAPEAPAVKEPPATPAPPPPAPPPKVEWDPKMLFPTDKRK